METEQLYQTSRRQVIKQMLLAGSLMTHSQAFGRAEQQLLRRIARGENVTWRRRLTGIERQIAFHLTDLIFPADQLGPSGNDLGVTDFIDEWVSAPFQRQKDDYRRVKQGFIMLQEFSKRTFKRRFFNLTLEEQTTLLNEIIKNKKDSQKKLHSFYWLYRKLAGVGYYTTPEGWQALGYVGNKAQKEFIGPPQEVLDRIGI